MGSVWTSRIVGAGMAMALAAAGVSRGSVFQENFEEDAVGSSTPNWYAGQGTSGFTKAIVDDSTGIGSGNALQINTTAGGVTRPTVTSLATQTLAVGDTLTLSFDIRLVGSATSNNRGLRFGLFNDGGTPVTSNISSGTDTTVSDDSGYLARVVTGGFTPITASLDVTPATGMTVLGTSFGASTSDVNAEINDTDTHTLTLTLTRTDTGITAQASMDGVSTAANKTDTTLQTFAFNEFAIFASHDIQNLNIDNVTVDLTPAANAPEPASLGLLAGGSLLMAGRRRRRSTIR